ncbi:MAG: UDP-glucose 4-epimerase GalE [Halanaerobiales bacterium]|nr:UDP-glucose 4-epimerase GalE [Halanaerobiales bacterium]
MKILVTGGAGYIGSHVVNALLGTEYEIVVLDNLQKGHQDALIGGKFIEGDLADRQKLSEIFAEHQIEGVIHLAADSLVGESMENPSKYYYNNVLNGYNLLEVMREHSTRYIVFSSTAAVYGEPEEIPITEDHPTRPTNVYGKTKLHFEDMLVDYEKAYGIKHICLRYFNAAGADISGRIGEDHNPESHLIPIVLQKVLGLRENLAIFGTDYNTPDGTCIRDYIHVNDLATAHILAIEKLFDGFDSKIYNLGNGVGFSVREVIETASQVVGKPIPALEHPRRTGDPAILIASSDKIKKELDWKPEYPELKKIIETAWNWHKNHPDGYLG